MSELDQESRSVLPHSGWILYDGGCGFCLPAAKLSPRTLKASNGDLPAFIAPNAPLFHRSVVVVR